MQKIVLQRLLIFFFLTVFSWVVASPAVLAQKKIVATTFPVYLFTKNLIGPKSNLELELLIDASVGCPHNYTLTPTNLNRLSQADILVINGLGLEDFLANALKVAPKNIAVIDASQGLLETTDNAEKEHQSPEKDASEHQHEGPNPHIFSSPKMAAAMVLNIADGLTAQDPEAAAEYVQKAQELAASLNQMQLTMKNFGEKTGTLHIAASHDVFNYLTQDLGWEVAVEIATGGAEEISAARLSQLISEIKEKDVRLIMIDPTGDLALAKTLGEETALPVVVIDPVSSGPADAPLDYYQEAMKKNLLVLASLLKIDL